MWAGCQGQRSLLQRTVGFAVPSAAELMGPWAADRFAGKMGELMSAAPAAAAGRCPIFA